MSELKVTLRPTSEMPPSRRNSIRHLLKEITAEHGLYIEAQQPDTPTILQRRYASTVRKLGFTTHVDNNGLWIVVK